MADLVHPTEDPKQPTKASSDNPEIPPPEPTLPATDDPKQPPTIPSENPEIPSPEPTPPTPETPVWTDYVIFIPTDQDFPKTTPEHEPMQQICTRPRANRPRTCCCLIIGAVVFLAVLAAVPATVFTFVFRPEKPKYSVSSISIKGLNNVSSPAKILPEFDVTIRANNPNKKIGIYYGQGSSGSIYHSDVKLCEGDLPVFYQPPKNATTFKTVLKGSSVVLRRSGHEVLMNEQKKRKIPFNLRLKAPVKFKVGLVKTWTLTVNVYCDFTVENLTAKPKILSNDCEFSVKPW